MRNNIQLWGVTWQELLLVHGTTQPTAEFRHCWKMRLSGLLDTRHRKTNDACAQVKARATEEFDSACGALITRITLKVDFSVTTQDSKAAHKLLGCIVWGTDADAQ